MQLSINRFSFRNLNQIDQFIMKRIFLVMTCIIASSVMTAQEGFKLGIQGGLPFNDFNNVTGVVLGADAGYMHALGEVVDLGVSVGIIHGFPETFKEGTAQLDLPSIQFLPLAASLRIWTSNSFSFGGKVGYALGINDGNDGGLYYRPIIGYLMSSKTELNISYTGIQLEDATWSTVTLGIQYTFESGRSLRR